METLHLFGTPGAEGAVAGAAARGRDPFGVRDDRAGRRVVGRHQHRDQHRARRRRLRHQRPQVVDLRRGRRALQDLHRHGQDRPGRGGAPAAVDGARAPRHARAGDRPAPPDVRLPGPARALRAHAHRRARARDQPARRGGRRVRDRPGPAGPRADPPLHAADRDGRAGDRPDGAAGAVAGWRSARPLADQGVVREQIAPVADRGGAGPAAGAQDGLADRQLRRRRARPPRSRRSR